MADKIQKVLRAETLEQDSRVVSSALHGSEQPVTGCIPVLANTDVEEIEVSGGRLHYTNGWLTASGKGQRTNTLGLAVQPLLHLLSFTTVAWKQP